MVRRPSLPLWRAEQAYYALLALALWELPRTYWNRPRASARDLYEGSLEKWRVFGEFGAPAATSSAPLCGEALSDAVNTRTNQYGGITTAYKSKDSSITSYAHTTAGRWSTHTSGQQHCLPWRAAAARSDGGLHA